MVQKNVVEAETRETWVRTDSESGVKVPLRHSLGPRIHAGRPFYDEQTYLKNIWDG